ncbi:hypothetical protein RB195_005920 [Necator americanus]|uniref:Uncharacterized protein n=1 Tax=Necator americanus TaxID=51031 RepID=A0ABR1BT41_NECAM
MIQPFTLPDVIGASSLELKKYLSMPIPKLKTKLIISDVNTTQKGVWDATSEAVLGVTDPEIEEDRESNSRKTLNSTSIIIFVCFGLLLALIIIGVVSVLIVQKRQYKRKLELAEEMRKEEEEERKRKKKKRRRHKKRKKRRKEREKLSKKQEDAKQCFDVKTALVDYLENQTYSRITPLDEQQSAKREGSGLLEDQPNKNDEQIVQTPKDDLSPKNEGPDVLLLEIGRILGKSLRGAVNTPQRETKTTDTGSNVMKPLIYGTAAAAVLFIGVVIVMWMIKERRKRIKKLELLESLEKEKTGKKRKRKRRHRRTRGPKPVIKVKQSEKLKKALADYLEMHTQTIGSRRSWW